MLTGCIPLSKRTTLIVHGARTLSPNEQVCLLAFLATSLDCAR